MRVIRMMALAAVALMGAACADLEVENLNDPDRERAINTPADVEALISGSFRPWHRSNFHYFYSSAPMMSVMADDHTATWGNFGMNDGSREPREPINNDPSYGYSYVVEQAWTQSYRALSGIRDGLIAIEGGVEIGDGGEDTHRAITFARLMQGLALGTLALQYDQAFVLDETTDLEAANLVGYQEVSNAAIAKLQEAINLAGQEDFTIPASWMGQIEGHDDEFVAQLAHTYIARIMANTPRSVAERDAVDWGTVLSHLDQGITSDWVVDGASVSLDALKSYAGTYTGWARWDMRSIGPADQSGRFQAWTASSLDDRNAFVIDTDDRRLTPAGHADDPQGPPEDEDGNVLGPGDQGLYVEYMGAGSSPWPAARGTYNYSDYRDYRWDYYSGDFTGIIPVFGFKEVQYLRAEAMIRTGNEAGALPIINEYRVNNGELPPATLLGDQSDRCVPRDPVDGSCPDLWEVLKYEKRIETFHANWATAYFDDRGWGDLVTNTAVHFPIPGEELLLLLRDIYTFGGGGEGSAPDAATDFAGYYLSPEEIHDRRVALETFDEELGAPTITGLSAH